MHRPQGGQCVAHLRGVRLHRDFLAAAGERVERPGQDEDDAHQSRVRRAEAMTAARTQRTGGRPSAMTRQRSPPLVDPYTLPERVPK
jgi:hypothetical protein